MGDFQILYIKQRRKGPDSKVGDFNFHVKKIGKLSDLKKKETYNVII